MRYLLAMMLAFGLVTQAEASPHKDVTLENFAERVKRCLKSKKCKDRPKRITLKRINKRTQVAIGYNEFAGVVLEIHTTF